MTGSGILLPGWTCPCGRFNGAEKEWRTECSVCGLRESTSPGIRPSDVAAAARARCDGETLADFAARHPNPFARELKFEPLPPPTGPYRQNARTPGNEPEVERAPEDAALPFWALSPNAKKIAMTNLATGMVERVVLDAAHAELSELRAKLADVDAYVAGWITHAGLDDAAATIAAMRPVVEAAEEMADDGEGSAWLLREVAGYRAGKASDDACRCGMTRDHDIGPACREPMAEEFEGLRTGRAARFTAAEAEAVRDAGVIVEALRGGHRVHPGLEGCPVRTAWDALVTEARTQIEGGGAA